MSPLSYPGSKLALIYMVLVGSPTSICTALASLGALKVLDVGGMAEGSGVEGTRRLSSLNLIAATTEVASSMLSYSHFSACYVLASTVITLMGLGILSLR
jgi:hypothetical protein